MPADIVSRSPPSPVPKNLEIKVPLASTTAAVRTARRIGGRDQGVLHQDDIYYRVRKGRLKLRIINHRAGELIYYQRPDTKGGRQSDYSIVPVPDPDLMDAVLRSAFGVRGVVKKHRRLFLYKNARIHIDTVEGLGTYLEFEVVMNAGKAQARRMLVYLTQVFGVRKETTTAGSYADLLERRRKKNR